MRPAEALTFNRPSGAQGQHPRDWAGATGRYTRAYACVYACLCGHARRVRPGGRVTGLVLPAGRDEGACPVQVDGDANQLVVEHNSVRAAFNFDRCFGQDSSQEHVFDEVRALAQKTCAHACG